MDKSWILLEDRRLPQYEIGVNTFLDFAYSSIESSKEIRCPCRKCNNVYFKTRDDVEGDLYENGILKSYTTWIFHGEEFADSIVEEFDLDKQDKSDYVDLDESTGSDIHGNQNDIVNMQNMLEDSFAAATTNAWGEADSMRNERNENAVPEWESDRFMRLLKDADKELYPGCKSFSKLSFVVTLMHVKVVNKWSNTSFSMVLKVLQKVFPDGTIIPDTFYEAKKMIQYLGLDYEKIDACVNDCVLYRKEYAKEEECPKCSAPRYKFKENRNDENGEKKQKKIPQKILRYFPSKPRVQRLFISKKTAQDMRWHKEKRTDDGVLRHPADAQEWKEFDKLHESFAQDPRNIRLGLATDGFNPFSNMSLSHSTWPVILLPYNLPPWKCLKAPFFILSMLIPGPKSPGNDIDVFLEPLVDELKELWDNGIKTYDASTGTSFNLRAALLWTINDFPDYGLVSGWSTKGYFACPVCNKETASLWLPNGKKICYMNHRRFLPCDHKWRDMKSAFDGKKEYRDKPVLLIGDDMVEQLNSLHPVIFGKSQQKNRKRKRDEEMRWNKVCIFFSLPYWRTLSLRHNLDVMHIEKNICDNILGTLLDIDGKSKDNVKARLDLQHLQIRHQLHPKKVENTYLVPPACYTLSKAEKRKLCAFLASVKYPDAFAASLPKRVNINDCRITGLKTHDSHVILQHLLPISVRGILNNNVNEALHEFSHFFKQLCSKTLTRANLEYLECQIALTLCKLERIFPPAFFDIMVHLPIHLAREAILGGPVQYRWMYPIERYLYKLKQYVKNKVAPEGSIAEGYLIEECLTFCSMYMDDIETQFNKIERNFEVCQEISENKLSVFSGTSSVSGKGTYSFLDEKSFKQVHAYVLENCDEVVPFISEHKEELKQKDYVDVEKKHKESFANWFEERVKLDIRENRLTSEDLLHLSYGPDKRVTHYEVCVVNGFRFHTKQREIHKRTQNSGVVVKGDDSSGFQNYYGILQDIVKFDYLGSHEVVLFKCDWYEGNDWKIVIEVQARSLWNVLENKDFEDIGIDASYQEDESCNTFNMTECSNDIIDEWYRNDIPSTVVAVDANTC